MEKFLTFLSNYYLYFLIAAGVLFLALIGFIVDIVRDKKANEESLEEVPTVTDDTNTVNIGTNTNDNSLNEVAPKLNETVQENGVLNNVNPVPPEPVEENIPIFDETLENNNVNSNNQGVFEVADQNYETPVNTNNVANGENATDLNNVNNNIN